MPILNQTAITTTACDNTVRTICAARDKRKRFIINNRSGLTLYWTKGGTDPVAGGKATMALLSGAVYIEDFPCYTGIIEGVLSGAGPGNVDVTEDFTL